MKGKRSGRVESKGISREREGYRQGEREKEKKRERERERERENTYHLI